MNSPARSISEQVRDLADQLSPDATWDDVMEEIRYRRAVEAGISAADRGAFATDDDVRAAFARWGVKS